MEAPSTASAITVDEFAELYRAGKLVFFAGSGISYGSGLPSAEAVLRKTITVTLPGTHPREQEELCAKIQPEVFYETLLEFESKDHALMLWRALHPSVVQAFGSAPMPNIVHSELVRYWARHSIPVFTTNFDTLFEDAARTLGLPCQVFLPSALPPRAWREGTSAICKLHGSIAGKSGDLDLEGILTTMTDISRVNYPWVERLTEMMNSRHICFVGYSGRDIDLFPFIEAATKEVDCPLPVWVNHNFVGDPAEGPSRRCQARRLEGQHPSVLFERLLGAVPLAEAPDSRPGASASLALDDCAARMAGVLNLPSHAEQLLRIQLLAKLGHYKRAHQELESTPQALIDPTYGLGWLLAGRLSHEVSEYRACSRYACRSIVQFATSRHPRPHDALVQGLCLFAESKRMQIPFDTYFEVGGVSRWLQTAPLVLLFVLVSIAGALVTCLSHGDRMLSVGSRHELLEHRVRMLSILQGGFISVPTSIGHIGLAWLRRRWCHLGKHCHTQGYADGIANCQKFLARITRTTVASAGVEIYRLLKSNTGLELSSRNEANELMNAGRLPEARDRFETMSEGARLVDDNYLGRSTTTILAG